MLSRRIHAGTLTATVVSVPPIPLPSGIQPPKLLGRGGEVRAPPCGGGTKHRRHLANEPAGGKSLLHNCFLLLT